MNKVNIRKIFIYLIGTIFIALGSSLIILSELGTSTWNAVFVGLFHSIGLTIGFWSITIFFLFILFNYFLSKGHFEFSALITIFLTGLFMDFFIIIVFKNYIPHNLAISWLFLILGLLIFSFGIAFYMKSNIALHPVERFMKVTQKRFRFSYIKSRLILEVFACGIALFLKGPIFIGTLIIMLTSGFLINFFTLFLDKIGIKDDI